MSGPAPKVSVIMAVHNGLPYVEQAIGSVLQQHFHDFELLIIDDGSTDRTPELLDLLQRQDARIVVMRQRRAGLTSSLARAAEAGRGVYLARQDADDVSRPGRLGRQVRWLDAHPGTGAVGTAAEIIDEEGHVIGVHPTSHGSKRVRQELLAMRGGFVHGSMMIRREALDAVGGYREAFAFAQDLDLWLRMVARYRLENVREMFYAWRANPRGIYATQRALQLKFAGIAVAFARERTIWGRDSYELLRQAGGDLDAFAARYRLRGFLYALWGELLFRAFGVASAARPHLKRAVFSGCVGPKTLSLLGWSLAGWSWPGRTLSAGINHLEAVPKPPRLWVVGSGLGATSSESPEPSTQNPEPRAVLG